MTYVIIQNCINDASCVPACPVNAIHPAPDEPGYGTTEMLYIDPDGCIDCGACLDACPVSAIEPDYDLPEGSLPFLELNAAYYRDAEHRDYPAGPRRPAAARTLDAAAAGPLRVAVVGTGPAASYAVEHLLAQRGLDVTVDVFEKLLTPWGLLRFGVAPDHGATKAAAEAFGRSMRHRSVRVFFDVTVGEDITHEDLASRYHAVLYGVGASLDRRIGVPGEDLPGSVAASEFVAWYNGHPDAVHAEFNLAAERAVVIGNGNVALDVARILATDVDLLRRTDIADHALERLAESRVREVRVVGRRGADASAFTAPELIGLRTHLGPRLMRVGDLGEPDPHSSALQRHKRKLIEALPTERPPTDKPVVVLDYYRTPVEITGEGSVEGMRFARTLLSPSGEASASSSDLSDLACGLVIRSVGYRSRPIDGLPFDELRSVVPNDRGRVRDGATGEPVTGAYVTGWVKRGPSGVIGTNRYCAQETVDSILEDLAAGRLPAPVEPADIADRLPNSKSFDDWRHLDAHERLTGRAAGRDRVKLISRSEQVDVLATRDA